MSIKEYDKHHQHDVMSIADMTSIVDIVTIINTLSIIIPTSTIKTTKIPSEKPLIFIFASRGPH
jgi:hypothetical protein